jgi:hypothetical protein
MKCSRIVSDTGAGIAPEEQETVFEEFPQVGTASKTAEVSPVLCDPYDPRSPAERPRDPRCTFNIPC